MKTSSAGRALIAQREGNKLKAYRDSIGVWTIGVGHTSAAGDPKVTSGLTITAAQSDEILARDLGAVENDINALVKVPMTQNQFDALVSLVFNIGGGNFRKSSVLRKINAKQYGAAAVAFLSWNKAGGKVVAGLTTRRNSERKQFLATSTPASAKQPVPAPLLAIEPKPAPEPAPVTDSSIIEGAQKRLTELRYNPGGIDGKIGPLTAGAIRVFRADAGLPPGDFIDSDFLTALATAQPRKMVPERANATGTEIAAKVPEANSHWWNKYIGLGTGAVTAAGGALDQIAPATGYLQPVKDFLGDIPTPVWIAAIVIVAGVIWWNARAGQQASDAAYRAGDRR